MYTKHSQLPSRRKYCIMGCHRWSEAKPWLGQTSMFQLCPRCKRSRPCVSWAWHNPGPEVPTVCITPQPHHTALYPELIFWKGWWGHWGPPTRSILDNLVLMASLVRPRNTRSSCLSWEKRCWQLLPHRGQLCSVCTSSDCSPNVTWTSIGSIGFWVRCPNSKTF